MLTLVFISITFIFPTLFVFFHILSHLSTLCPSFRPFQAHRIPPTIPSTHTQNNASSEASVGGTFRKVIDVFKMVRDGVELKPAEEQRDKDAFALLAAGGPPPGSKASVNTRTYALKPKTSDFDLAFPVLPGGEMHVYPAVQPA